MTSEEMDRTLKMALAFLGRTELALQLYQKYIVFGIYSKYLFLGLFKLRTVSIFIFFVFLEIIQNLANLPNYIIFKMRLDSSNSDI